MRIRHRTIILQIALCWLVASQCDAAWTFVGPTPYLSKADSPFPVDGSNPNFYLEDFEPDPNCVPDELNPCIGNFDTPGARMVHGGLGLFNSVDADDGVIDGSGADGFSAQASTVFITGSSSLVSFRVDFAVDQLTYLPTAVGFVLTDGAGEASGIGVYDALGNHESYLTWDLQLDP
jgi:hypothetical protein